MKRYHILFLINLALILVGGLNAQTRVVPAPAQEKPILLEGATIHTGTGQVIENGLIGFAEGKITVVGAAGTSVPNRSDYEVIDVAGKQIYPGLILIGSSLGLVEVNSVKATFDYAEQGDFNPNVRALVAYNTDSELIPTFRYNGILLTQSTPSSGMISGTSSVVQLDAWNWEDAAYQADDAIHMNWPTKEFGPRWWMNETEPRPNPNYNRMVQEAEQLFADAIAYGTAADKEETNLKLEAMQGLFNGDQALFIHTNDARSIVASIKMARKFGVERIVLVGGYQSLLVKDLLVSEKIPVVLNGIHELPDYDHEDTVFPYKMAKEFTDAGIEVIISGGSGYDARNMCFFAGTTVARGLDYEKAVEAMTLAPAKALGIADRAGSLEKGKDAMILIVEGDLLDMRTSKVEQAYIQGRKIQMDARQQWLYKKYSEKYGHDVDGER